LSATLSSRWHPSTTATILLSNIKKKLQIKLFCLFIFIVCNATASAQSIQLVKDINTGASNEYFKSSISNATTIGTKTYFTADDGTSGREPWITDGTAAGTYMLRDINPGLLPSIGNIGADQNAEFTYSNGLVFF